MTVLQVWRSVCSLWEATADSATPAGFCWKPFSVFQPNMELVKSWLSEVLVWLKSSVYGTFWQCSCMKFQMEPQQPFLPCTGAAWWHTTSCSLPAVRRKLTCIILLSLSYTGKQKRGWGGIHRWKSWQEHLSSAVIQHCDSISVSHLSYLVFETAPAGGLALHKSNHCHESAFGVTGFDLFLAAQSQAVSLKAWGSFIGIAPEQLSRERSFIPKGIFSDFIEKALVCCFPKNDLKTFDIWKLSCYDQRDESHG